MEGFSLNYGSTFGGLSKTIKGSKKEQYGYSAASSDVNLH